MIHEDAINYMYLNKKNFNHIFATYYLRDNWLIFEGVVKLIQVMRQVFDCVGSTNKQVVASQIFEVLF